MNHSDIDVNIKDNDGDTPLKNASDEGHLETQSFYESKHWDLKETKVLYLLKLKERRKSLTQFDISIMLISR